LRISRRAWLSGLSAAVAAGSLIAGLGAASTKDHVDLLSGAAWLPSRIGQVALLSGTSGRLMAQVPVAAGGDYDLEVVQAGSDAYTVNHTAGTVVRVDGATFATSPGFQFAPSGGDQLSVFSGGAAVFVLDGAKGLLYRVDPKSLVTQGSPRVLDANVTDGGAVVDGSGRLWVVDRAAGALKWFDAAGSADSRSGVDATATLLLVAGAPVLVAATGADWLGSDGDSDIHVDFGLRAGEVPVVSGSDDGRLLVVVPGRNIVEICDRNGCDAQAFPLTGAGKRLGAAILDNGVLVVPDLDTGRVHLVDTATAQEIAAPQVLPGAKNFELFEHDTVLFYNDPATDQAGILRLDGTFTTAAKYQPDNPNKGIDAPSSSRAAPAVVPPQTGAAPSDQSKPTDSNPATTPPDATTGPTRTNLSPTDQRIDQPSQTPTTSAPFGTGTGGSGGSNGSDNGADPGDGGDGPSDGGQTAPPPDNGDHNAPTTQTRTSRATPTTSPSTTTSNTTPPASTTASSSTSSKAPVTHTLTVNIDQTSAGGVGGNAVLGDQGGLACPATCTASLPEGAKITLTTVAGNGYRFAGWSGVTCPALGGCTITLSSDMKVHALFEQLGLLVVVPDGDGTVTADVGGIDCPGTCSVQLPPATNVTLTAHPGARSTLTGWKGLPDGKQCNVELPCTVTMTDALTISAVFSAYPTLTVSVGNGGTVASDTGAIACPGTCAASIKPGTTVTLTAAPEKGRQVTSWSKADCGSETTCTVDPAEDSPVQVTFGPVRSTVHLTVGGGGTVEDDSGQNPTCSGTCEMRFDYGTRVSLTAVAETGHDISWGDPFSGTCGGTATCLLGTLTDDLDTSVAFPSKKLSLAVVIASGSGTVTVTGGPDTHTCRFKCTFAFDYGTQLTITADPDGGINFTNWSYNPTSCGWNCVTFPIVQVPTVESAVFDAQAGFGSGSTTKYNTWLAGKTKVCVTNVDTHREATFVAHSGPTDVGQTTIGGGGTDCRTLTRAWVGFDLVVTNTSASGAHLMVSTE